MNHASRRSLVVPVLPAASSVKPCDLAAAAVPSVRTLRIMFVTRYVVSARATARNGVGGRFFGALFSRIRLMAWSGLTDPALVKIVYASVISIGVASKTPSAIDGNGLAMPTPT